MVMNPDYDLASPLASALKATAPYVGIPIPGHAPLIFKRSKLKSALNGVKPVYIAVTVHDNGERSLTVEGVVSKRCRTFMRMLSLNRNGFYNRFSEQYKAMEKWNPVKAPAPRLTKHDKALAKLEKQLAKLGSRPTIQNPCLSCSTSNDHESFLRWHQQKPLRQQIGKLAVEVRRVGGLTARQFYVELAKLTTVKRYSDFTDKQRERIIGKVPLGHDGFFIYSHPKNLWKFLPGIARSWMGTRPRLYWGTWAEWEQEQAQSWGTARYQPVLEWSRARQEILSQIQAIKDMATVQHPAEHQEGQEKIAAPKFWYHGTSTKNLKDIVKSGFLMPRVPDADEYGAAIWFAQYPDDAALSGTEILRISNQDLLRFKHEASPTSFAMRVLEPIPVKYLTTMVASKTASGQVAYLEDIPP